MTPYYQDSAITIYHGDCREILPIIRNGCVSISDPPYNVGYEYEGRSDNLPRSEYLLLLRESLSAPSVIIHYPEDMFAIATAIGEPNECAAWTYNAHTPRKWRMVAWFGVSPDFSLVKQPFKNIRDRRIIAKLDRGDEGCSLYDWWHEEQVKNVSAEKTEHPCQIPLSIMQKILGITTGDIIDPFMGSGTTLRAAKDMGRKAIGIDIEERYCEIAAKRMAQEVLDLT